MATSPEPGAAAPVLPRPGAFAVTLENFTGPFDLLLSLIAKHKLDVTEVALSVVTDEFIAHLRAQTEWDLSQASEFLVVAATLLDLKAARLLPGSALEDSEDLELLEARDLLFARLLQYRAFKEVAEHLRERAAQAARSIPRGVGLEPEFSALLPELVLTLTPEQLAMLAAQALTPKAAPEVGLDHLHAAAVSVREQAALVVGRLRRQHAVSFRDLTADADSLAVVVARFLALLELFREGVVAFEQMEALAELTIRWAGADDAEVQVRGDFDEVEGGSGAGTGGRDGTGDHADEAGQEGA